MIIGPDFVWVHFPKCAGTETTKILEALCRNRADVTFDPHEKDNVIWHQSVAARMEQEPGSGLEKKRIICNIRRLPAWLLSRIHYELRRSPQLSVSREMLLEGRYVHLNGGVQKADDAFRAMTAPRVDAWIRSEHLAEDFERAFAPHLDLSVIDWRKHVRGRNSLEAYIRDPAFYFTEAELAGLYAANPLWAAAEKAAYGSLTNLDMAVEWVPPQARPRQAPKTRTLPEKIGAELRRFANRLRGRRAG